MSRRPARRVALFSHDSQGLGHIRRNIEIAAALARHDPSARSLLISGAPSAASLALPPRTQLVPIPAVQKDRDGSYLSRDPRLGLAEVLAERGRRTAAALRDFEPDLVIVDKHARGLQGELAEPLAEIAARRAAGGGPAMVLGLRDILDEPRSARREWQRDGTTEAVLTHYDQVWVYGDPAVHDPVRSYGIEPQVAERMRYTGYLSRGRGVGLERTTPTPVPSRPFVLGLLGGGQDGAQLAEAFAEAPAPPGHLKVLVTGPYIGAATLRSLWRRAVRQPELLVLELVPSTLPLMRRARAVVTMGGYNTVCEVLETGSPVLVVPRTRPRQEQAIRADLLAASTHLEWLPPDAAGPDALARWLRSAVRRDRRPHRIDLDGPLRLPALADAVVAAHRGTGANRAHA